MDIHDGFIVGIFNYCDSWCAACPFTSRCRLFADGVEREAAHDPTLKPVIDAPPLPGGAPPGPPASGRRTIQPGHAPLCEHARTYVDRVFAWLRSHERFAEASDPEDPRAVVTWFYSMIYVKIHRAVRRLADDDRAGRDWPADDDGSAKVALLAVERSQVAWIRIVELGMATWNEAEPFLRQLLWLHDEIERVFPGARAFVRPGFDEPEQVAQLLASDSV
jgi:hypothetical protein